MKDTKNRKLLRMSMIPFLVIVSLFYVACLDLRFSLTLTPQYTTPPEPSVVFTITATVDGSDPDDNTLKVGGAKMYFYTYIDESEASSAGCGTKVDGTVEGYHMNTNCDFSIDTGGYHTIDFDYYDSDGGLYIELVAEERITVWIKATPTVTFVDPTPDTAEAGESITLVINVTYPGDSPTAPAGTFTITDTQGNTICANVTLDSEGIGECTYSFTSGGTTTLTATYNGDENYVTATGQHTINVDEPVTTEAPLITTTTSIISAASSATTGQSVNVTVSVARDSGTGTTPGYITIDANGEDSCVVTLTDGVGSCSISFSTTGSHVISATYTPTDSAYEGSSTTQFINVSGPANQQPAETEEPEPTPG